MGAPSRRLCWSENNLRRSRQVNNASSSTGVNRLPSEYSPTFLGHTTLGVPHCLVWRTLLRPARMAIAAGGSVGVRRALHFK